MGTLDKSQDGFTEQDLQLVRHIPLISTFVVPTATNC